MSLESVKYHKLNLLSLLQAISSIRAHLEKFVSATLMKEIEELAEGFLKRLLLRHTSRVIVSPVSTNTLPSTNFS